MLNINIKNYVKYAKKEYIYEYYTNVIREGKDYEKITREKICLEILDYIQDIRHFSSLITYKEYLALTHIVHNDYQENDKPILRQLVNRLLVIYDQNEYTFFDEFKETIESHLQNIDVQALKDREQFDNIVLAILKTYGVLSRQHMEKCLKHYLPKYSRQLSIFLNIDYYLQYYSYDVLFFENLIVDKTFEEFYEQMETAYTEFEDFIKDNYFVPEKDLLSIFQNGLNLNQKSTNKLYQQLSIFPDHIKNHVIQKLNLFVHIQAVIDEESFQINRFYNPHLQKLLPTIQEVSSDIPSAMFHGLTENQFLRKYPRFKSQEQAKLSTEDAFLFYKLYFALLEYTNNLYYLQPKLTKIYQQTNLSPSLIIPIRDYLFEHRHIIDDFINENPYNFTNQELDYISCFKQSISDIFIIMEYDQEFTYLLGRNCNFAIKGLHSTIEEVIPKAALPYASPMNLIPFKDVIIYDGIITGPNLQMSSRLLKQLQKDYKKHKTYYSIYTPTRVS